MNNEKQQESEELITNSHISWHKNYVRWIALLLACLFQLGSYFSTDFPSIFSKQITSTFGNSQDDVQLLYTYYSLPNVILPLLGGLFIDILGIRLALVSFYVFLILGQGLCVIGPMTGHFYWMLAGRLVFGLGGENCVVAQSYIVSKWFVGKELAFALGLNITFARLGSALATFLLPAVYDAFDDSLTMAMLLGFIILLIAWADAISLAVLDKLSDKRDKVEKKIEGDKISLKDVKEFKLDFYLLTLSCLSCYTSFFVFQYNNVEMFKDIYKISDGAANQIYAIPYYCAAVLTPIVGYLLDFFGKRTHLLIACGLLLSLVNVWFFFLPQCDKIDGCLVGPIIGQCFNGIYYSLYAAVMWPCVPLCVPERTVGTAFGVVNAVQNIGLAIFPLIIGTIIKDKQYGSYQTMIVILGILALIGFASNVGLFIVDKKNGGKMGKPSAQIAEQTKVEDQDQEYSCQSYNNIIDQQ